VPNLASAAKRVRQNERNRARNRARKAELKTETKKLTDALHDGKLDVAKKLFVEVTKKLDQVASKGTIHRNTVSRRKSRLAKRLNATLGAKAAKSK
jgi:small subunit ribosomal protein S20